jgi:hypothetical protein
VGRGIKRAIEPRARQLIETEQELRWLALSALWECPQEPQKPGDRTMMDALAPFAQSLKILAVNRRAKNA